MLCSLFQTYGHKSHMFSFVSRDYRSWHEQCGVLLAEYSGRRGMVMFTALHLLIGCAVRPWLETRAFVVREVGQEADELLLFEAVRDLRGGQ